MKEKERPVVTIPAPGVGVEKRERVERRDVETTGRGGCETKSVTKESVGKSKTVTKSDC